MDDATYEQARARFWHWTSTELNALDMDEVRELLTYLPLLITIRRSASMVQGCPTMKTCRDCGRNLNRGATSRGQSSGISRCLACLIAASLSNWRFVSAYTKRRS